MFSSKLSDVIFFTIKGAECNIKLWYGKPNIFVSQLPSFCFFFIYIMKNPQNPLEPSPNYPHKCHRRTNPD